MPYILVIGFLCSINWLICENLLMVLFAKLNSCEIQNFCHFSLAKFSSFKVTVKKQSSHIFNSHRITDAGIYLLWNLFFENTRFFNIRASKLLLRLGVFLVWSLKMWKYHAKLSCYSHSHTDFRIARLLFTKMVKL